MHATLLHLSSSLRSPRLIVSFYPLANHHHNHHRTGNKPTTSQYDFEFPLLWDAHKTRACVCDPKYSGLDCSIRMCPRGDYAHFFALEKRHETQVRVQCLG